MMLKEDTKINKLIVKDHDEPNLMTWYDAMEKFGPNGSDKKWRLPTLDELDIMFRNKDEIPNLKYGNDEWYWSSLSRPKPNYSYSYYERFADGMQSFTYKDNFCDVRLVRR